MTTKDSFIDFSYLNEIKLSSFEMQNIINGEISLIDFRFEDSGSDVDLVCYLEDKNLTFIKKIDKENFENYLKETIDIISEGNDKFRISNQKNIKIKIDELIEEAINHCNLDVESCFILEGSKLNLNDGMGLLLNEKNEILSVLNQISVSTPEKKDNERRFKVSVSELDVNGNLKSSILKSNRNKSFWKKHAFLYHSPSNNKTFSIGFNKEKNFRIDIEENLKGNLSLDIFGIEIEISEFDLIEKDLLNEFLSLNKRLEELDEDIRDSSYINEDLTSLKNKILNLKKENDRKEEIYNNFADIELF